MRIAQIILSVIIAAAVVYIVVQNDRPKSQLLIYSSNDFSVELNTLPVAVEDSMFKITVRITGPKTEQIKYLFRYAKPDMRGNVQLHRYGEGPLTLKDSSEFLYESIIRTGVKGTLSKYYIEIRDPIGRNLGGLKMPDGEPLVTVAVGKTDNWIYYAYYVFMFAAIVTICLGVIEALKLLTTKEITHLPISEFLVGAIFVLISGFALRTIFQMQLSGESWQGAPFGVKLTDNLKQILFFYLILVYLVSKNVSTKSGKVRTVSSRVVLGYLGIGAFFLMVAAFLLPILVNSPVPHITTVFYAFFALLFLAYFLMLRSAKNA